MAEFTHLFSPIIVGGHTVPNRIVVPAMHSGLASAEGEVTPELLQYVQPRALSGAGMMVAEIACVDSPRGRATWHQLVIDNRRYLKGLALLAERMKLGGGLALLQLHHAGSQAPPHFAGEQLPLAPSPGRRHGQRSPAAEASLDDIARLLERFASAARLAQEAGFDGVELHAAHGYLLSEFLSPATNHRQDQYGGDSRGRTRLVADILRCIRAENPRLVVGVRFNAVDFVKGGLELEEGVAVACLLEEAGAHYLHVSCGMHESPQAIVEPASYREGWRVYLAEAVRRHVKVPVIGGGVIRHPWYADSVIAAGQADMVFVGRAHLADPGWTMRARQGKPSRIRPCISCNTCITRASRAFSVTCAVNPRAGRESWPAPTPLPTSARRPRVLVVGGGPAGMTAAATLGRLGYRVTLAEADKVLGGMLTAAKRPPHKERLDELRTFLMAELARTPVDVRLGQRCDEVLLRQVQPEIAIVATGSTPLLLPAGVATGELQQAVELLRQDVPVQGSRVAVIGGGRTGCETALYLAAHGNQVTLLEAGPSLAAGLEPGTRSDLLGLVRRAGIKVLLGTTVLAASSRLVTVRSAEGERREIEVDHAVLALGFAPYDPASPLLKGRVRALHLIGDAVRPRNIESAMREGELVAMRLEQMGR